MSQEVEYALTDTTHTVIPKPCSAEYLDIIWLKKKYIYIVLVNGMPHSGFCTSKLHTRTIHSAYSRSLHWFAPPTITPPRCEVFDSMYNMFCHSGNVWTSAWAPHTVRTDQITQPRSMHRHTREQPPQIGCIDGDDSLTPGYLQVQYWLCAL